MAGRPGTGPEIPYILVATNLVVRRFLQACFNTIDICYMRPKLKLPRRKLERQGTLRLYSFTARRAPNCHSVAMPMVIAKVWTVC